MTHFSFEVLKTDGRARRARFQTMHGKVETKNES
jgi:queuine/archaeosine tRNA-ribosyltransferase